MSQTLVTCNYPPSITTPHSYDFHSRRAANMTYSTPFTHGTFWIWGRIFRVTPISKGSDTVFDTGFDNLCGSDEDVSTNTIPALNNNLSHNCPQIACDDLRKNRKLPRSIALPFAPIYVIPSVSTAPRQPLSLTATSARISSQGPPMENFQKIPLETSSSSFLPSFCWLSPWL